MTPGFPPSLPDVRSPIGCAALRRLASPGVVWGACVAGSACSLRIASTGLRGFDVLAIPLWPLGSWVLDAASPLLRLAQSCGWLRLGRCFRTAPPWRSILPALKNYQGIKEAPRSPAKGHKKPPEGCSVSRPLSRLAEASATPPSLSVPVPVHLRHWFALPSLGFKLIFWVFVAHRAEEGAIFAPPRDKGLP